MNMPPGEPKVVRRTIEPEMGPSTGIGMIEILVASAVLAVALLALLSVAGHSIRLDAVNRETALALLSGVDGLERNWQEWHDRFVVDSATGCIQSARRQCCLRRHEPGVAR